MTDNTATNLSADRKTTLTFEKIQYRAGYAWKLNKLGRQLAINHPGDMAGPLGDYEASDYSRQGETLRAIEIVLKLLAHAPNAYINREALDALQHEVELGVSMTEEEWIQEVLNRQEIDNDGIPF